MVKHGMVIVALVAFVLTSTAMAGGDKNQKRWNKRHGVVSVCPRAALVPMGVCQRDRDQDKDGQCDGDGPNGPASDEQEGSGPNGPDGEGDGGYGPGDEGECPDGGGSFGPGGE